MPTRPSQAPVLLAIFLDMLGFGLVIPFLSLQAREIFGVGEGIASLIAASYSAMQFLFMPVWGRISDRIGRRPVLLVSIATTALTMAGLGVGLAVGEHVGWLFLARILGGMATANIGTATAYVADITAPADRARAMGLIGMCSGLGFMLGPFFGGMLADIEFGQVLAQVQLGHMLPGAEFAGRQGPLPCFLAAFLSLVNLLLALRYLGESLPPGRRSAQALRLSTLAPLQPESLKRVLRTPGVGRTISVYAILLLGLSGLQITFAFFAVDAFALTQQRIGVLFLFMGVLSAAVQGGLVRVLARRFREDRIAMGGIVIMTSGFALMPFSPALDVHGLWLACALLSLGSGLAQPSLTAFVSRLADADRQGETLSTNQSMASLARVGGPILGGALYGGLGPLACFGFSAALMLVTLGIALGLRGHHPVAPIEPAPGPS